MPIIKSKKKSVKTSAKSHLRNISVKSKVKKSIKDFELSLTENEGKEAGNNFVKTVSALDKAFSHGIISKNTASRNKSRLAKKLNVLGIPVPKKQETVKKKTQKVKKEVVAKETVSPIKEDQKIMKDVEKPVVKKAPVKKEVKKEKHKRPIVKKAPVKKKDKTEEGKREEQGGRAAK